MDKQVVIAVVAILAVGMAVVLFLLSRLGSHRVRTAWPVLSFAAVTALLLWEHLSPVIEVSKVEQNSAAIRIILAIWWLLAAHLVVALSRTIIAARGGSREARLSSDLIAAVVYIASLLAIMNFVLDLPVRGLLVTSGVIAVIMGLALQTTMSDVFSGIAVGVEAPFAVGDWISVDDVEGQVSQINWRSVHLIVDGNDLAVIPNSVIAKAKLMNRSVPTPRRLVKTAVDLPADFNPDRAIGLLQRAILLCPTALETPVPTVALAHLGQRLLRYEIVFHVANTSAVGPARDRLLQEIHRQCRAEAVGEWGAHKGVERAETLGISFFELLPPDVKETLYGMTKPKYLHPGQVLFREGDAGNSLYVVGSGILEVQKMAGGDAKKIGRIGPGDYFGEIGLLTGAPHAATVTALVPTVVHELLSEDLKPILEKQPALTEILEASAQRGMMALERAVAASTNPPISQQGRLMDQIRAFLFQRRA